MDPMEFDWGKPFYVITDEGYLNHTKTGGLECCPLILQML